MIFFMENIKKYIIITIGVLPIFIIIIGLTAIRIIVQYYMSPMRTF